MIFRKVLALEGPNVWSRTPVLEVHVELASYRDVTTAQLKGLVERLTAWLPDVAGQIGLRSAGTAPSNGAAKSNSSKSHSNGKARSQGTASRLLDLADALSIVCLELQKRVSAPASWSRACQPEGPDVYGIAVAYEEEEVGRAALDAARTLCIAGLDAKEAATINITTIVDGVREVADRVCLGPSTRAIVRAAQARGIPFRRLNLGSFVQLGHGAQQRRVRTAETDATSAVAEIIAQDKELTKSFLRAAGVPVPEGRPVSSPADAWAAAEEIGVPVVVKPRDGNHGRGVYTALMTQEQVESAFTHASEEGDGVLVERFAIGAEHRLLVVGGKFVAGVRGDPAIVIGDGKSTIAQLVESQLNSDPRRGETDDCPLAPVWIDRVARLLLSQRGYTAESIPPIGDRVLIQYNGNLSIDITDEVHPEVAARLVEAACVVGLDVAGIDVVAQDISRPLEEQGGVIVEVNAGPGLHMHLYPSEGKPRPVGDAIVASLYPTDPAGRVPLVGVLESQSWRPTTRGIAEVLHAGGAAIGVACPQGIYVSNRRLTSAPTHERRAADMLLANSRVESAVVGITSAGILGTGMAVDVCDIAVVAERFSDLLSNHELDAKHSLSAATRTLFESVPPQGYALVDADDHAALRLSEHCKGSIVILAGDDDHASVMAHRGDGDRAVFVRHGQIIAAHGGEETFLASLGRLPVERLVEVGVTTKVLLMAAAVGWLSGRSPRLIRAGLESLANSCIARRVDGLIVPPVQQPAEADVAMSDKDPKAA